MAEPVLTRKQVRQYVCQALRMPFFRRWNELNPDTTSAVGEIIDTTLTQDDGYWENQWCYVSSLDYTKMIVGWDAGRSALTPESNFATAPTDTDTYELHQTFNAQDIHEAINRAIEDWPEFFDVVMDESMALCEDKTEYALSSLTTSPWQILKIWIEQPDNGFTSVLTAYTSGASQDVLTVSSDADLSSLTTNYYLSVYDGPGAGEVKPVTSHSTTLNTVTFDSDAQFSATLTSDSKIRVWDASQQTIPWRRMLAVTFDQRDWPTKIYFKRRYSALEGARIRLQYLAKPTALTTDASTTFLPREYLVEKTLEHLFASMANSNRFSRARYTELAAQHGQKAESIKMARKFRRPESTLWTEDDSAGDPSGGPLSADPGDPLGWWS